MGSPWSPTTLCYVAVVATPATLSGFLGQLKTLLMVCLLHADCVSSACLIASKSRDCRMGVCVRCRPSMQDIGQSIHGSATEISAPSVSCCLVIHEAKQDPLYPPFRFRCFSVWVLLMTVFDKIYDNRTGIHNYPKIEGKHHHHHHHHHHHDLTWGLNWSAFLTSSTSWPRSFFSTTGKRSVSCDIFSRPHLKQGGSLKICRRMSKSNFLWTSQLGNDKFFGGKWTMPH